MAKTSVDARRHIREWSAFFADISEAGASVVEEFIRQHRQQKYLRQSLRRLIAKGFLREQGNRLKKTAEGERFLKRYAQEEVTVAMRKRGGKWYLLGFDIPVAHNLKRDALRRLLMRHGFLPLQKSVLVGDHSLAQEVWEFIVDNRLEKYCTPMVVEILEGEERLLQRLSAVRDGR